MTDPRHWPPGSSCPAPPAVSPCGTGGNARLATLKLPDRPARSARAAYGLATCAVREPVERIGIVYALARFPSRRSKCGARRRARGPVDEECPVVPRRGREVSSSTATAPNTTAPAGEDRASACRAMRAPPLG